MKIVRVFDDDTEVVRTEIQGVVVPRVSFQNEYPGTYSVCIPRSDVVDPRNFISSYDGLKVNCGQVVKDYDGKWFYGDKKFPTRREAADYVALRWIVTNQPHLRLEVTEGPNNYWKVSDSLTDTELGYIVKLRGPRAIVEFVAYTNDTPLRGLPNQPRQERVMLGVAETFEENLRSFRSRLPACPVFS